MEEEEATIRFVQSSSSDQLNPILIVAPKKKLNKKHQFSLLTTKRFSNSLVVVAIKV
jgi:hypothetical protein